MWIIYSWKFPFRCHIGGGGHPSNVQGILLFIIQLVIPTKTILKFLITTLCNRSFFPENRSF